MASSLDRSAHRSRFERGAATMSVVDDARLYRCKKCGQEYPIVPYFKAAASHGPSRDCVSREWEPAKDSLGIGAADEASRTPSDSRP